MDTTVRLDNFTGPLDLLLHLVRENEVDIHGIPVARIAQQYLDIVHKAQELDMEVAGEFLLMAATLAEMKSRRLIPEEEEEVAEEDADDPRLDLIRQLLRFRYYKERAGLLEQRMLARQRQASRPRHAGRHLHTLVDDDEEEPEEIIEASVFALAAAFARMKEQIESLGEQPIVYDDIPVEDKIEDIIAALREKNRLLFDDLIANPNDIIEIVTTLCAVLELVKQRLAAVRQLEGLPSIVILRPADAPPIGLSIPEKPEPPLPGSVEIASEERRDALAEELASAVSGVEDALTRVRQLKKILSGTTEAGTGETDEESADVEAFAEGILQDLVTDPETSGTPHRQDSASSPEGASSGKSRTSTSSTDPATAVDSPDNQSGMHTDGPADEQPGNTSNAPPADPA